MKIFKTHSHTRRRRMHNKGFTLVELMVALTLFVIVVVAAVSSLYSVNNASRKVNEMRIVLDNLNFAVESISRTVRTGDTYACGGYANKDSSDRNCSYGAYDDSGTDPFYVRSTLGRLLDVEYRIAYIDSRGEIQRRTRPADSSESWSDWIAITSPEIDIKRMQFFVSGANADDGLQPGLMMFIEGVASAGEGNVAPFSIQTFVSQRAAE